MRHLGHHPANGRRVLPLDHLVQPRESQSLDHQLVLHRSSNGRTYPFELDDRAVLTRGCCFWLLSCARHNYSSSTALPRCAATSLRSRNLPNASKVALITLCG